MKVFATEPQILCDYRAAIALAKRDRISAGKRTKLTRDERQTLIDWFVESLKEMDDQANIQSLCQAEMALLEEGYPFRGDKPVQTPHHLGFTDLKIDLQQFESS